MSPAATLTVPAPQLLLDPPAGPPSLEKPITLSLGDVLYPDATPLGNDDVRTIGVFVFRGRAGSEQVWDEGDKTWKSLPIDAESLAGLTPVSLMPAAEGAAQPWTGVFVAAGQKDASGGDRFTAASSGTPSYRLRAFAKGARAGQTYIGLSAGTSDLLFTSTVANQRFVVELDPKDPGTATTVRLILKNAALARAGFIEIRATGGQELDIANCTSTGDVLARLRFTSSGDIRLEPAAGRRIELGGELHAETISYQPSGGGSRTTL